MTALAFDRSFDITPGDCTELSPLVRRVVCGNASPYTFKGTSSFIVGHRQVAIIDPGPDDDQHLAALLYAVRGETVSHIFVTHRHMDHAPLAQKLKAATGAPIYAAKAIAKAVAGPVTGPDASIDQSFVPDVRLSHGETVAGQGWTMEAVFTPGHLFDHMAFALAEEKALFSGDHVMAWATSVIAPPDGNMGNYIESLRLLLARDDHVFHPGHGPSRLDPKPLVRGYLAHRKMREDAILRCVRQGHASIEQIVKLIYADVDPKLHGAAALSTQAHLEHLMVQGRVRESRGVYQTVGSW